MNDNYNKDVDYIKNMLEKDLFTVIFPDDGKYESAQTILD